MITSVTRDYNPPVDRNCAHSSVFPKEVLQVNSVWPVAKVRSSLALPDRSPMFLPCPLVAFYHIATHRGCKEIKNVEVLMVAEFSPLDTPILGSGLGVSLGWGP